MMLVTCGNVVHRLRINLTIPLALLCVFVACRGTTVPYLILFVIQMMTHKNQFVVLYTKDYDVQVLHAPVKLGNQCYRWTTT